jgi:acyl-coenzyme A synthetase/AMP-(fatty) acid ligase
MLNNRPTSLSSDEIPHLRFLTSSSAPLLVEDWKRFEALYEIPISQGYGASECGWIAGSNEKNRRLGSVGRPLKYQNVKIIDNAGKCQPENIQGNIAINPSKNKEYLYLGEDGEIKTDGVGSLITGDIGYIDDDGFLFVTGREKDLIITGGVNVSPLEIENVLMELDSIVEAAAIGIKDQIYGEQVVAFVVLLDGVDEKREKILDHCQQKLAKMKIPRLIEFLDKLPKTTRGKLDRNKLKNIYSNLNQK